MGRSIFEAQDLKAAEEWFQAADGRADTESTDVTYVGREGDRRKAGNETARNNNCPACHEF